METTQKLLRVDGLAQEHLLAIAFGAVEQLGWEASYVNEDLLVAKVISERPARDK